MKGKKIIAILSAFLIPCIFMGCTKGTSESKRETLINNDKSVESNLEDTNDKIDEDLVNEDLSEITLSYDYKTISFDDWQVDIPSSWIEYGDSEGIPIYLIDDTGTNTNILSESVNGIYSEVYMSMTTKSLKDMLDIVDDNIISDSKIVNGIKVNCLEYVQKADDNSSVYTYQTVVFKDDRVYILTMGAYNQTSFDNNKALMEEVITTVR